MIADPLLERLADAFSAGVERPWSDAEFDRWAREVFSRQFEGNEVYRRFCEARDVRPDDVGSWRDVPPVPTSAFKHLDLTPGPVEARFETSGTTRGSERRGRHGVPSLSLYRAASLPGLRSHMALSPDGIRILSLIPSVREAPGSSLSTMMGFALDAFGADGSGTYADPERGVEVEAFAAALRRAADEDVPVWVAGTAFAFVHWIDAVAAGRAPVVRLPEGSRIMETGGFKGRSREVSRSRLYADVKRVLGVPDRWIVNEYGMTELLSQFWDGPAGAEGRPRPEERRHRPPPWMRSRVVDPVTLDERPAGQAGLLLHLDLANVGSVAAILTEDRGIAFPDGTIRVLGRAPGAEPRGCSLALEDLLEAR
jgi:hypothetical protein